MNKALFIHGGPGFNSEAEKRTLEPLIPKGKLTIHFWNEPSRQRRQGFEFQSQHAFDRWLDSVRETLTQKGPFDCLIASSFGALAALYLLQRDPRAVTSLILVAPTLDLDQAFRKMMSIAVSDFETHDPAMAQKIRDQRARIKSFYDEPMRQAMSCVYQDPSLIGHYWRNQTAMQSWGGVVSEPGFMLDFESQAAVLDQLARTPLKFPKEPLRIPVTLVLGAHDPVQDEGETLRILKKFFSGVRVERFADSGHFPQLEQPEKFLELISRSIA